MSKQRPSPGGQRPSPARAPTRTSRRVGIGQGDLPHTKIETSASRMHGNHKEQNSSHGLNRWKERLALQHRHAGMSTGSEPCILRGILSKGPQALMTRLGPSHDEGTRDTAPQNSEFSVHNVLSMLRQCIQPSFQFVYVTSNVQSVSIVRAVAQCYQYNVFYQGECSYQQGSGPMLFVHIMWPPWKETISHFCDALKMWIISNSVGIKRIRNQPSVFLFLWKFFVPGRNQRNQSVQWNFCTNPIPWD